MHAAYSANVPREDTDDDLFAAGRVFDKEHLRCKHVLKGCVQAMRFFRRLLSHEQGLLGSMW